MLLRALRTEIERDLDLARSTRNLLVEERDMLQGDVKERLIIHRFHTDIWAAMVAQGAVDRLETPETVARCYERLAEVNELVKKFNDEGDAVIHSPLIDREGHDYGRENVLEIMREQCETAESILHDAHAAVDDQLRRTCLTCGAVFESEDACREHERVEHDA